MMFKQAVLDRNKFVGFVSGKNKYVIKRRAERFGVRPFGLLIKDNWFEPFKSQGVNS